MVVNLVDNAAEAMQDSLVKRLLITTQPGAAETVELVIADTGCGVSAEEKEKLFLPYFSTKGRGTGLGLAIVNHILSDHGAQIRVEDNQPAGARFTIEIPALVEAENGESGAEAGRGQRMKPVRILIVDDEPDIRQFAERRAGRRRLRGARRGERRGVPGALGRRGLRTGAAGHLAARHGRHGGPGAHPGDAVCPSGRWW